jgi:hypothetical protein
LQERSERRVLDISIVQLQERSNVAGVPRMVD